MNWFDESKQRTEQRREERAIFEAFTGGCPGFADEQISEWRLAEHDPPDVFCTTRSGRRVGVEICQWIHEGEMKAGKAREKVTQKLLDAIGSPQPANTSKNFWMVGFSPRAGASITPPEFPTFRRSLLLTIEHVDADWPTQRRDWNYCFAELNRFPPLDKYLESVHFAGGDALTSDIDWIVPVAPVYVFDDRTMPVPLLELVAKKRERCIAPKTDCDEMYLLIAYDLAVPYCSPVGTPHCGIKEIAKEAAAMLAASRGPFSRAFLFMGLGRHPSVYRLL